MNSGGNPKALRDALWQAAIESAPGADPYSIPLEETVERLHLSGSLTARDADTVNAFLRRFNDEAAWDVPADVDTDIARIVASLRSIRRSEVQDTEGRGVE